jgi:hypothetical protein
MCRFVLTGALAAAAFLCFLSSSEAGILVPIPNVPGSVSTNISTINNKNLVAGDYQTSDGGIHGFFGTLDGNYTTFDALSGQTSVQGLNDRGYITGLSRVTTTDCPYNGCEFLRKPDGTVQEIKNDKTPLDGLPGQIIDQQNFIGYYSYFDGSTFFYFGYYGKGAKYVSDLTLPFQTIRTHARGLARDGTVTGHFLDRDDGDMERGFILKDGIATAYDYPDENASNTEFESINKRGLVPGAWLDGLETFSRAFLFNSRKGKFLAIDVPGSTYAFADGINDAGVVAVSGDTSSYIYCPSKKTCPLRAGAMEVPDRWIAARSTSEARLCEHECLGPSHLPAARKPVDVAALRAAIARDPDLQRELRLQFRP